MARSEGEGTGVRRRGDDQAFPVTLGNANDL